MRTVVFGGTEITYGMSMYNIILCTSTCGNTARQMNQGIEHTERILRGMAVVLEMKTSKDCEMEMNADKGRKDIL